MFVSSLWGATSRSDVPLSQEQMQNEQFHVSYFAASSRNFYYYFHVEGFQISEGFLRFEVDPGQEEDTVNKLAIEADESHDPRALEVYKAGPIDHAHLRSSEVMAGKPLSWWQLDKIQSGFHYSRSFMVEYWIDRDRHLVYEYKSH